MLLDLNRLAESDLDAAARHFDARGFLVLEGLEASLTPLFAEHVRRAFDVSTGRLEELLETRAAPLALEPAVRARLARIAPDDELRARALTALEPLLLRLVGAFLHVNSTFHAQFKGGPAPSVDHGGYREGAPEVQGGYLLHQDFTGAKLATSPSAVTLWVPINDCDEWTLRLYPGSHRRGLLCNRWLPLDDPRLAPLGAPLDVAARRGRAVLFHALALHGSSNPGPTRRVSCDLRFFPLCAFLPSTIHTLGEAPFDAHRTGLDSAVSAEARAPFLESLHGLGQAARAGRAPDRTLGVWAAYLERLFAGDRAAARAHFERLVDRDFAGEGPEAYARLFDAPQASAPLRELRARLAGLGARAGNLAALDRRLERLQRATPGSTPG